MITIPFGVWIIKTSIFEACEIPIDDAILEMKLISLGVCDFYVIMGMDWLSTHRASVDCFTRKVVFRKSRYPELECEDDGNQTKLSWKMRLLSYYMGLIIRFWICYFNKMFCGHLRRNGWCLRPR